jgi:hypothetical protein
MSHILTADLAIVKGEALNGPTSHRKAKQCRCLTAFGDQDLIVNSGRQSGAHAYIRGAFAPPMYPDSQWQQPGFFEST